MQNKSLLLIAFAAAFIGGSVSRFVLPISAQAQATTPAPKEVRAQSFVLTDENGNAVGIFTSPTPQFGQKRAIVLLDQSGQQIWSAGASAIRPLSQR